MEFTRRQLGAAALASGTGAGLLAGTSPARAATGWSYVDAEQRALALRWTSFAAKVSPAGQFQVVHQVEPNTLMPLASSTKVFVMVAIVEAVRTGRYSWNTLFTLADQDRALGSGSLGARPTGTRVTLQTAATHIFHESDNTAASMMIRYLGQPAMARAVVATGHPAPSRLYPFPTLRQDLWLNWSKDPWAVYARRVWTQRTAAQKTALLAAATRPGAWAPDMAHAVPVWIHRLGYFTSAAGLARAHVLLHRAQREVGMAPLRAILVNPTYLISKPSAWTYLQFKGGTAPGIKVGSWYAETARGDQVLVMMQAATGSINLTRFNAAATVAAGLLARS